MAIALLRPCPDGIQATLQEQEHLCVRPEPCAVHGLIDAVDVCALWLLRAIRLVGELAVASEEGRLHKVRQKHPLQRQGFDDEMNLGIGGRWWRQTKTQQPAEQNIVLETSLVVWLLGTQHKP